MKNKKDYTIDEYIEIAKKDIMVFSIILIIIFSILLYVCYKIKFYYYMYFSIFGLFLIMGRIINYIRIRKIKSYLINNNLIKDMGKIFFWNEDTYMLTDKYIIIIEERNIIHFEYQEIEEIYDETNFVFKKVAGDIKTYLHIKLNDKRTYKILISSMSSVNIVNKNIIDFLLEKNENIKVLK